MVFKHQSIHTQSMKCVPEKYICKQPTIKPKVSLTTQNRGTMQHHGNMGWLVTAPWEHGLAWEQHHGNMGWLVTAPWEHGLAYYSTMGTWAGLLQHHGNMGWLTTAPWEHGLAWVIHHGNMGWLITTPWEHGLACSNRVGTVNPAKHQKKKKKKNK